MKFSFYLVFLVVVMMLTMNIANVIGEYKPNEQVPNRPQLGSFKGKVFLDRNKNSLMDDVISNQSKNIFINVLRYPGFTYAQVRTKDDGSFEFGAMEGEYKLEFVIPQYAVIVRKGFLDNIFDSDINQDGKTDYISITSQNRVREVNAGYQLQSAPKGDYNGDGSINKLEKILQREEQLLGIVNKNSNIKIEFINMIIKLIGKEEQNF
ncbi:MAG: hypothetical protein ACRCXZ_10840 [Patescibacteria group bacterium]